MNKSLFQFIVFCLIAVLAVTPAQLWAQDDSGQDGEMAADEAAADEESEDPYEDAIVVYAQKREQNLQEVSLSVTALDEGSMERGGIASLDRIELLTPGMAYGFIGTDAKIAIRGANSNNTFADNQSVAGFFVDGVFRPRAAQQVQQFFDVEQVEVLKGPQGTLYGRNTFAGAVNLYTKAPKTDGVSGGIKLGLARFDTVTADAAINLPANDNLAFRLAINTKDSGGYITNLGSGEDHGQDEARNFRGSMLWVPNADFEFVGRYTSLDNGGIAAGIFAAEGLCRPINGNGITDVAGLGELCDVPRDGTVGPFFLETPHTVAYNDNTIRDWHEDNLTADATWNINDNMFVRSISSYTDFTSEYDTDGDFSDVPGYIFYWDEATESLTQEVRLHHRSDRVNTTAGLYWSEDEVSFGFSQFRAGIFPFSDFADFQIIDVSTTAAFVQTEIELSDDVRMVAGIRFNDEEKDTRSFFGSSTNTGPFTADPATSTPLPGVTYPDIANGVLGGLAGRPRDLYEYTLTASASAVQSFDSTTWKLGFEWDAADGVMAYANAATGFLSGGVNANGTAFDVQDNISYEAGVKSRFANGAVRLNMAAYHVEGTNLTTQIGVLDANNNFITSTVNGGEVTTDGIDLELSWQPSYKWFISALASIMDSEHKEFGARNPFAQQAGTVPPGNFLDLRGTQTPWSPDATLGFSASYNIDKGDSGIFTPHLQFYYSDEYNTDDVVLYAQQVQPSYTKTDLRLTWSAADGGYGFEAYIENLEDEAVLARTNVGGGGFVQTSYQLPRNYGLRFSWNF